MATYKVIQDIEAEDKFLGPLTLKQFIFFAAGSFFAYLNVFAVTKGGYLALAIFVPPMLLGFFLAIPWSKDQPTEVWVLAKLRFRIKPKKRIWNQSGMEELVTITVPKKIEKVLTNNLSQVEVKSRLKALAETIDSHGWATKHTSEDRLVDQDVLPKEIPVVDLVNIPDAYDEGAAVSTNFDHMIEQSSNVRLEQNLEKMDRIRHGEPLENITQPEVHFTPPPVSQPMPAAPATDNEKELSNELRIKRTEGDIATGHMRGLAPVSSYATTSRTENNKAQAPSSTPGTPAIMNLSRNDDLSVATIARQAQKTSNREGEVMIPPEVVNNEVAEIVGEPKQISDENTEVVISLH